MPLIEVRETLDAPIEDVFEVLSDHARYSRFPGIQRSELVREGDQERNGVGALRRIAARPLRFTEEITGFERPTLLEYIIRDVNAPMLHRGGRIALEAQGQRTSVHWTSDTEMTVPVLGGALGALARPIIRRGFRRVLCGAERLAVSDRAASATPTAPR